MSVESVQVICIDSDHLMHQALGKVLLALGISFRCFSSIDEISQHFSAYDPSVMVIDVATFERSREFQSYFKGRSLALVAGPQMQMSKEELSSLHGIGAVLERPIDKYALTSFLGEVLDRKRVA